MGPLTIKKYPEGILRQVCQPIEKITENEIRLFHQMLFSMRYFCGIGLAAPQIGIAKKIIVAEVGDNIIKLANPEILDVTGSDNMEEGCLSVPGVMVDVDRPARAVVKGVNEKGEAVEMEADGLLARVLQHEIDHLSGKLIIDYRK